MKQYRVIHNEGSGRIAWREKKDAPLLFATRGDVIELPQKIASAFLSAKQIEEVSDGAVRE